MFALLNKIQPCYFSSLASFLSALISPCSVLGSSAAARNITVSIGKNLSLPTNFAPKTFSLSEIDPAHLQFHLVDIHFPRPSRMEHVCLESTPSAFRRAFSQARLLSHLRAFSSMLFRLKSEVPADTNFRGEKSKKKLRVWIGNSGNAVGPCLLVGEIINLFRHIQEFTAFFGTGFSRDKK